jgi:hypothetical protein
MLVAFFLLFFNFGINLRNNLLDFFLSHFLFEHFLENPQNYFELESLIFRKLHADSKKLSERVFPCKIDQILEVNI